MLHGLLMQHGVGTHRWLDGQSILVIMMHMLLVLSTLSQVVSHLGVLVVLGPRLGKFGKDGSIRNILPHNPWMVCVGLFIIYAGFWGFYVACNVPLISPEGIGGQITGETWTATTIYLTPTTLRCNNL